MLKKIDIYVLKNFLTLFLGTLVISIFILMMQSLWKWIDDLAGKGLEVDVLAKFFLYAGETIVPLALPLAILLASLISFGNMGERLELLAMKAAGIPLVRILRPIAIAMVIMTGVSYFFQDYVAPYAYQKLFQMLFSVRQTSPTIDIPEGAFYDGIDGVNLYVKEKDPKTDMLYEVIIYELSEGASNARIILADSALLETTADKQHLLLHLYSGEQFENLKNNAMVTKNVPYRRETFVDKHFIIDFSTDFALTDNDFSNNPRTKRMGSLFHGVDSISLLVDSTAFAYYDDMKRGTLIVPTFTKPHFNFSHATNILYDRSLVSRLRRPGQDYFHDGKFIVANGEDTLFCYQAPEWMANKMMAKDLDSLYKAREADRKEALVRRKNLPRENTDTLFNQMNERRQSDVIHQALQKVSLAAGDMEFRAEMMKAMKREIRQHKIRAWEKVTLALSCLIFFFIGAPLGAIIRKGGLGMPVVVAVIIFLVYYIINSLGTNLATAGTIPTWLGMWFSTLVLAPIAYYLTIKSNNDSVVFNIDTYRNGFRKLMGIRSKRNIYRKEVIIEDPDYAAIKPKIDELVEEAYEYRRTAHLNCFPNYLNVFFRNGRDEKIERINSKMENCIEALSNSKDRKVLKYLNGFPVIDTYAHTAPFKDNRWNKAAGYFFPAGIPLLFRINRFRRRLSNDLKEIVSTGKIMSQLCEEQTEKQKA